MKLLVDIGNTRLKWAWLDGTELRPGGAVLHGELEVLERALGAVRPVAVWASNVAGAAAGVALAAWTRERWGLEPRYVVSTPAVCGVRNGYTDPRRLGVDRWLGVIAAHRGMTGDVCIIDCGTAITIDLVTAAGQHQGGLIAPGPTLMRRALAVDTGVGVAAASIATAPLLAHDTAAAVQGGTLRTAAGFIEHVVTALRREYAGLSCVLTGGDAPALLPLLSQAYRFEPHWVLQGLAHVVSEEQ